MKAYSLASLLALSFLTAPALVRAADNQLTDAEKAGGWKLLFDGNSTTGWANRSKTGLQNWGVADGALNRNGEGGDAVYVAEKFEDFELSIDWRTQGNSGVFVRMSSQEDWLNTGLEIQVLPTAGTSKHSAGSLYDLEAPPSTATVRGGWNNFRIVCDGPIVACKMNGVETFRIDLRDAKWQKPQGKFNKAYASLPRSGWIMLQDHGSRAAYKNIKLRPLPKSSFGDDTFLDPAYAGREYPFQGEYLGTVGEDQVGGQIVALGGGKFNGVFYVGGLPGDGWDGTEKIQVPGELKGDQVLFQSPTGTGRATLRNGVLEGTTDDGFPARLTKIHRASPTLHAPPPANAVVLFDGTDLGAWENAHIVEQFHLAAGTKGKQAFQDFKAHFEFLLPFKPMARGQGRGNSGVYLQNRYEVQVLDSFGLAGENNECGGIYGQAKPRLNMCFPPLVWQTYDFDFKAARFDADGKKTKNATATIRHNGVVIHDNLEFRGPTGGGQQETPEPGPFQVQGHGNPVFYRNIWVAHESESR